MPVPYSDVADGRYRLRVRETHLRDHVAPLLAAGAHGVVKMDLVLRGLAPLPHESQTPGLVAESLSWEQLHDLARPSDFYRSADRGLKRKWVSDKVMRLDQLGLLRRQAGVHRRPQIVVLRDDGSGDPFDDPTGDQPANYYVTVLGTLIASGRLQRWGSPQIAAYLAAMVAERHARSDDRLARLEDRLPFGGGFWFRPLTWFADEQRRRPPDEVRIPFAPRTLRRGLRDLEKEGLIHKEWVSTDPRTGKQFENGPRVIYHNGFDDLRAARRRISRSLASLALLATTPEGQRGSTAVDGLSVSAQRRQ